MKNQVLSQGTLFSASLHNLVYKVGEALHPAQEFSAFLLYVTVMSPSWPAGYSESNTIFFFLSIFVHLPTSPCNGMTYSLAEFLSGEQMLRFRTWFASHWGSSRLS